MKSSLRFLGITVLLLTTFVLYSFLFKGTDDTQLVRGDDQELSSGEQVARRSAPNWEILPELGEEKPKTEEMQIPFGTLELYFYSEEGPVEGVKVGILNGANQPTISDFTVQGVSDKQGIARFKLEPGHYRWTKLGEEFIEITPGIFAVPEVRNGQLILAPIEKRDTGNLRKSAIRFPDELTELGRLSESFEIRADKTARFENFVHRGMSISGRLPLLYDYDSHDQLLIPPHEVKLYSLERIPNPSVPGDEHYLVNEVATRVLEDENNVFTFQDLKPGEYIVQAFWMTNLEFCLYRQIVEVHQGDQRHLGELKPNSESSITLKPRIIRNGEIEQVSHYALSPSDACFSLRLTSVEPRSIEQMLSIILPAQVGRPMKISGLTDAKRWRISIQEQPHWFDQNQKIESPKTINCVAGDEVMLEFTIHEEKKLPRLQLALECDVVKGKAHYAVLGEEGRGIKRTIYPDDWKNGSFHAEFEAIVPGKKTLVVWMPESNRYVLHKFNVSAREAEVQVQCTLLEGGTLSGYAYGPDDTLQTKGRVVFSPEKLRFAYTAEINKLGKFELSGLPPEMELFPVGAEAMMIVRPNSYDLRVNLKKSN
ncbi:MAG: hypothetical protein H6619_06970 [Deltaproteobacteria bacterium]|nr:hypothetical protein [Deltaproteobacteria bacterium]